MTDNLLSTGEVANLLTRCSTHLVLETQLAHALRKQKIQAPPITAGRRLWSPEHVLDAARHLGINRATVLAVLRAAQ